jgi:hypothetical protein
LSNNRKNFKIICNPIPLQLPPLNCIRVSFKYSHKRIWIKNYSVYM